MQINNTLSRWQLVPLVFMQDGFAAAQTNVQLPVVEVHVAAGQAVTDYAMPFAGEIVGISYSLEAAATTGTATIGPTIAGVECADPTLTCGTAVSNYDRCPRGTNTFAAGALIGAEVTTGATWDGTGDLVVNVWVLLRIDAI
jgi:hypothetical protein